MFGKLMKYEMKSLSRGLLPLYGAVLVMAGVNRAFMSLDALRFSGMPQFIAAMVYFGLCVAVGVLTLMTIVQRFYKGLLGDEGYLMHTLPVRPAQLVTSKLTAATLMTVLSGVAGILSVMVLTVRGWAFFSWGDMLHVSAPSLILFLVESILLLLFWIAGHIAQLYTAMALGHLSNQHRVALSFVWYMVISTALTALIGAFFHLCNLTGIDVWLTQLTMNGNAELWTHLVVGGMALAYFVKTALFCAGTTAVLKNKLNLE